MIPYLFSKRLLRCLARGKILIVPLYHYLLHHTEDVNSNTEESSALDRAAVACKDRLGAYYNVTNNANICDDAGHEFYVCILLCICIVI